MKIYMLDEIYEYAKKTGIYDEMQAIAAKRYRSNSIQEDLNTYHDIINSDEFKALGDKLLNKLKEEDPALYNLHTYTANDSYTVANSLLNSIKNMRARFVLLDKVIAYKLASVEEFDILVTSFCRMYEEVAEDIRANLPKYIHLAYFKYVNLKYCYHLSTSGGVDIFDEYEKFITSKYKKIYGYINAKDTLENQRLEMRCVALQYILPLLDNEGKRNVLKKVADIIDLNKLNFDNKFKSIGIIWTYDRLLETYFDLGDNVEFFRYLYMEYMYIENAMSDKASLFDALRYYSMNHITSFIIALRRFYTIQNLFIEFNMKFTTIPASDEKFILDPDLDYTMYDSYANKLVMEKYKTYVDVWFENNKQKLKDLSLNKAEIARCKRIVIDKVSDNGPSIPTPDSSIVPSAPHVEDHNTTIPDLPPGYTIKPPTPAEEHHEEKPVTAMPEEHHINLDPKPTEIPKPAPVERTPDPEIVDSTTRTEQPAVEDHPSETVTPPTPPPATDLPPLPGGLTVNENEVHEASNVANEPAAPPTSPVTKPVVNTDTTGVDLSGLSEEELRNLTNTEEME